MAMLSPSETFPRSTRRQITNIVLIVLSSVSSTVTARPGRWTGRWSIRTSRTRTPSRCSWARSRAPGQRRSWRSCSSRTEPSTRSTYSETAARTLHRAKVRQHRTTRLMIAAQCCLLSFTFIFPHNFFFTSFFPFFLPSSFTLSPPLVSSIILFTSSVLFVLYFILSSPIFFSLVLSAFLLPSNISFSVCSLFNNYFPTLFPLPSLFFPPCSP